ncbi:metallophosphoesterase family protein [Candidatus Thioglobus sp.]|uniref:metallophosphoesterase family protein n=1 Tax=Candidatus Thioglobus sp. TaxID=2026721 RepID=UPI003D0EDD3B
MKPLLTIGILSDTHGFIHPGIISLINQCDIAIHAGDIIDKESLLLLKPKQKLVAVQGNNDAHLTQFKMVEKIDLPGGFIMVDHGHTHGHAKPSHGSLKNTYADAKMVVYGHSHKQLIEQDSTPWIVNPGAAGNVRNHGGSKCLVLTIISAQNWQIKSHIFSQ